MRSRQVDIYEPLWKAGQTLRESAFLPLTLPDNRYAAWREFRILIDFFRRGAHRGAEMTGIFSPKFRLKSGITGTQFLDFARRQHGADVCFINVFPTLPYTSYNVWMQGEAAHPGLTERAQRLLAAAGFDWDLSKTPRHHQGNLCYGNFWVATPAFWDAYVGGVLDPLARFLESCPQTVEARAVLEPTTYVVSAPFLPFIVERLFSTFVSMHPEWHLAAYPLDGGIETRYRTQFGREMVEYLRERIDAADAEGGHFPAELIQTQELFSKLSEMYHRLYFERYGSPHVVPEYMPPEVTETVAMPAGEGGEGS